MDFQTAALDAGEALDDLFKFAEIETGKAIENNDIPLAVQYFDNLRNEVQILEEKVTRLQKCVNTLSYELLPTMFTNQGVRTITVRDVGRVTVNVRWNASMPDKQRGMEWLRKTGNEGLIIETVNAQTLGAFARTEALAGRPLPEDSFKVSAAPYISITKA